jgi:hypothetical protein
MSKITCGECVYSDSEIDPGRLGKGQMFCRRFPPTGSMVPTPQHMMSVGICPPVQPNNWCGEGKSKAMQIQAGGCG